MTDASTEFPENKQKERSECEEVVTQVTSDSKKETSDKEEVVTLEAKFKTGQEAETNAMALPKECCGIYKLVTAVFFCGTFISFMAKEPRPLSVLEALTYQVGFQ